MIEIRTVMLIILGFCALAYAAVVWVEKPMVRHFPGMQIQI